jgi:hypothetical protein
MIRSYMLEVATKEDPNPICDELIAALPIEHDASGVGKGRAFVRFRVDNDDAAMAMAAEIRPEGNYLLSAGYGINWRIVEDCRSWSQQQHETSGSGGLR